MLSITRKTVVFALMHCWSAIGIWLGSTKLARNLSTRAETVRETKKKEPVLLERPYAVS